MPAKKKPVLPETVNVRIAVMVGSDGDWVALQVVAPNKNYTQADRDDEAFSDCAYDINDANSAARYIVTATLPVPKPQTVIEVEGTAEKYVEPVEASKKTRGR